MNKYSKYVGMKIEMNPNKRMINDYKEISKKSRKIQAKKISSIKNADKRREAIRIVQDIIKYLDKQLIDLGEIEIIDVGFEVKNE